MTRDNLGRGVMWLLAVLTLAAFADGLRRMGAAGPDRICSFDLDSCCWSASGFCDSSPPARWVPSIGPSTRSSRPPVALKALRGELSAEFDGDGTFPARGRPYPPGESPQRLSRVRALRNHCGRPPAPLPQHGI